MITNLFSITELSNLTNKSRPSIYKYITCYEKHLYDDIPYSFIQLFNLISSGASKKQVINYCETYFVKKEDDKDLQEIITILRSNKNHLDYDHIKNILEKEINKNGNK